MKKIIAIISFLLISQTSLALSPAVGTFSDVWSFDVYYDAVEFLADEGIVNGNPDGTFAPYSSLNRAEMLKILVEATVDADIDSYGEMSCFEDVESGLWYTKYVCYAEDKMWVEGYENGKYFKPGQNVAFVEGLKMTMEAFDVPYNESEVWYEDMVGKAGVEKLTPFTITGFYEDLQRDEMADMVTRFIKSGEGELEDYLGLRRDLNPTYASMEANTSFIDFDVYSSIISSSDLCTPDGETLGSDDMGLNLNTCCEGLYEEQVPADNGVDLFFRVCVSEESTPSTDEYTEELTYFLVDLEDNGENGMFIGCMDSLIEQTVELEIPMAADDVDRTEAILDYLLALGTIDEEETGLYNTLGTGLTYDTMEIDGSNVYIYLEGELNIGGVCESPRLQGQLQQTVIDIFPFSSVIFYVNGETLDSLLYENEEE